MTVCLGEKTLFASPVVSGAAANQSESKHLILWNL